MDTDDHALIPFCSKREAFVFNGETSARDFIERFSELLLLEPVIERDGHWFLVRPEPINEIFAGE